MDARRWLVTAVALAILAALVSGTSAAPMLAQFPVSENYQLVASEMGDVLSAMHSGNYGLNQGLVIRGDASPLMESENYRLGGVRGYWVYLPLVLKSYS